MKYLILFVLFGLSFSAMGDEARYTQKNSKDFFENEVEIAFYGFKIGGNIPFPQYSEILTKQLALSEDQLFNLWKVSLEERPDSFLVKSVLKGAIETGEIVDIESLGMSSVLTDLGEEYLLLLWRRGEKYHFDSCTMVKSSHIQRSVYIEADFDQTVAHVVRDRMTPCLIESVLPTEEAD